MRDVAFDPLENDAVVIEYLMRLCYQELTSLTAVLLCGFMCVFRVCVCLRTCTYIFTCLDKATALHTFLPKENISSALRFMANERRFENCLVVNSCCQQVSLSQMILPVNKYQVDSVVSWLQQVDKRIPTP